MLPIGGAYGTAPAAVLRRRGPGGQLQPGGRALPRLAAVAEPADLEAGAAAGPAAPEPAGPPGGADRRGAPAAGAGDGDPGGGRGRRAPPAGRRRRPRPAGG